MKYFPLIWSGLARRPVRTVFTMLSLVVAFVLFGVLNGITTSFDTVINHGGGMRLRVTSRVNGFFPIPRAYREKIEQIPGVERVAHYTWFGGYYQDPKNSVSSNCVDVANYFAIFPEWVARPEDVQTLLHTPTGAIIGEDLAKKFGWKVGDRVPLVSQLWENKTDNSKTWIFDIVGIYHSSNPEISAAQLFANYSYLDESRSVGAGTVMQFAVKLAHPGQSAEVARTIDAMFGTSGDATYTQNEADWLRSQVKNIENITFFVRAVVGAVLFALLILTAVTLSQSVQERMSEFAVLKSCGYSDTVITALVIAEALLLCELAAATGLALATFVYPRALSWLEMNVTPIPTDVIASGFALAAMLALLSALLPVWRLHRLDVAGALAGR